MLINLRNLGFKLLHQNNLIYVTCWEDPRLDRIAMALQEHKTVLAITSVGCNVIDYALDPPKKIHAIDVNSRKIALLELKFSEIRELNFEDIFQVLSQSKLKNLQGIYQKKLRSWLSPWFKKYVSIQVSGLELKTILRTDYPNSI